MSTFRNQTRQQFRECFQPSRIVLGVLKAPTPSGVNVITLCFNMHCSYKPPMVAFSIQEGSYSYQLIARTDDCVLSVPGESLAAETLYCGERSGAEFDKVRQCGFELTESQTVAVPGIGQAIANIELELLSRIKTGDHVTVVGQVKRFAVNAETEERCLLSVGRNHSGYDVLASRGLHRIGVVRRGQPVA